MEEFLQLMGIFGGVFGGISLMIWTGSKAKIARIQAERGQFQPQQDSAVLSELQALKQQMNEMQSTGHQFDLSFDAALNRLEDRVSRVETKTAVLTTAAPTEPQPLQNGYRP